MNSLLMKMEIGLMIELKDKIFDAFLNKYGQENYVIFPNDVGRSFMNLISSERSITLQRAIQFTIEYLQIENVKEVD